MCGEIRRTHRIFTHHMYLRSVCIFLVCAGPLLCEAFEQINQTGCLVTCLQLYKTEGGSDMSQLTSFLDFVNHLDLCSFLFEGYIFIFL